MMLRAKFELIFCIISLIEILWSSSAAGSKHRRRRYYHHDLENSKNQIGWHDWFKNNKKKSYQENIISSREDTDRDRIHHYDWICLDIKNGFMCAFCEMAILCVYGKAYKQPCPKNTRCSYRSAFDGAVCHTDIPLECQCSGRNEIMADPYNFYAYHVCYSKKTFPHKMEMCPVDHFFHKETSTCKSIPKFPQCIIHGTFPLQSDCHWYYNCIKDKKGNWIQTPLKCMRDGMVFSASYKRCVPSSFLSNVDPCVAISLSAVEPSVGVVQTNHYYPVYVPAAAPAAQSSSSPESPRYVCTLLGRVVTFFFPGLLETMCARINK